jgi:predicted nucleic-acid-binding protein
MIAFDTNYLVRYLVQDHPAQCQMVAEVVASESGAGRSILLCDIVLCETVWVLSSVYGASREEWVQTLKQLLSDPVFCFQNRTLLDAVIQSFETGKADFSDYLIAQISGSLGCDLLTFDQRLQREL